MKIIWRKFIFLLAAASIWQTSYAWAGTSLEVFEISSGSAPFLAFEANTPFWGDWSGDPGTAVVRIAEPNSINGDGGAWRVTLADAANGAQRFSLVGWALNHLNTGSTTNLSFYVRGGNGGETFEAGLSDYAVPKHEVRKNIAAFIVGGGGITTSYKQIRIPLTQFSSGGVVLSNLDAFLIISTSPDGQTNVLYVDAMRFE